MGRTCGLRATLRNDRNAIAKTICGHMERRQKVTVLASPDEKSNGHVCWHKKLN